jgi:manganese/zinc/iron transport system permease protein
MALVAVTTVASFEQVGSILVIAMLIVPGATAHLLTDRLSRMLWIAAGVAVASAVLGQGLAIRWDTNTAGTMTVVVGLMYLAAAIFSPRYGVVSAWLRNLKTSLRIVREDLLAMLYRLEELRVERRLGPVEAVRAVGGGALAVLGLRSVFARREVLRQNGTLRLTDLGRRQAAGLVRSHRLWEAYLVRHLGLPLDHVHEPATRMEHFIDERLQRHVAADLGQMATDPHGREIPPGDRPEGNARDES